MNTYRQGFDGKWPGEPKGVDPSTHPKQVGVMRPEYLSTGSLCVSAH